MTQNKIEGSEGGAVTFAGPEAVNVYRITVLRSAIGLLQKGITPTRGMTMKKALAMAGEITGKKYTRKTSEQAREDLRTLADQKAAAIHTVNGLERAATQGEE